MGKYMRKVKVTGDVAVMEVSPSSLGVRTRAKTLALQRLQASTTTTTPAPPPPPAAGGQDPELSYLQLRSRRLEKPPLCRRQNQETKNQCRNPNPRSSSRLHLNSSVSTYVGSGISIGGFSDQNEGFLGENKEDETEGFYDLDAAEASFGENNLDFEAKERSTRESTPISLIRDPDALSTPGSSTRPTNLSASNRRILNSIQRSMPTAQELEEFFARAEQQHQRLFAEKYNFDVVNDMPLQGRYEWVRVQP